jgi:hypothetical protein
MSAYNFIDLTGKVFGRLTVIEQAPRYNPKVPLWSCRCSCGGFTTVAGKHLRGGATVSCGCVAKETTSLMSKTHGLTDSPEYKIWCGMKRRCYNKHERCYPRYGGRGIKVCDRWLNSFTSFLEDMGTRPCIRYSIERIDVDKDYEPTNCKWLPLSEQARNRRNSLRLTANGETRLLVEWAEITGIPYSTLQTRLGMGWSNKDAVSTPIMENRRSSRSKRQPK